MKSMNRSWTLTKEGSIHEVKNDHEGPKSQKEGKKKEIIIIKKKEEDHERRIPVGSEDMQQEVH